MENSLRYIPKMDDLIEDCDIAHFKSKISSKIISKILRVEIEGLRNLIKNGEIVIADKSAAFEYVKHCAVSAIESKLSNRLKRIINATGIIIHTNLGRAPLHTETAVKTAEIVSGYNNLEYSILDGKRGSRLTYVEELLKDITGAEAAVVVNNNAAAIYLALHSICKSREVIVSRGEIVEIGGSFRVSEIIEESGCIIKEVGTTNKTKSSDYEKFISPDTAALLKVHRSNFKIIGFTGEVSSSELINIKNRSGFSNIAVIEDMGSGVLADLTKYGFKAERTVQEAVNDDVDIITFSGDKLLGGPQAGIIVGKKEYIDRIKKNQMYRCLRIDKMCLIALENTLWQYLSDDFLNIPVIKMILEPKESVEAKAHKLNSMLEGISCINTRIAPHMSMIGGGALPGETIDSYAVFISSKSKSAAEMDAYLRSQSVPIVATIQNNEVIFDLRTVDDGDFGYISEVFKWA